MAGKKYRAVAQKIERRPYALSEAIPFLQANKISRFDETVELHLNLGVDPRHADQMVRGTVILPHGLGIAKKVLVFASGAKVQEALDAGADFAGGDEYIRKIAKDGWLGFDAVVSTPDMMRFVSRLGRILGPRGLMPNPKSGTVTLDVASAVGEVKAGKLEFRVDKGAVIHAPVGKLGFESGKLAENAETLISAVLKARPHTAKGRYLMKASICSTMSPALTLNVAEFGG
jgi:large subunit ribosomal protein L1